jgi:uncharacterized membrane protein
MKGLARHQRFLTALALGFGLGGLLWARAGLTLANATILGFDGFALIYLGLSLHHIRGLTGKALRRRAGDEDEGMALILLLVAAAVGVSFWAIIQILTTDSIGVAALIPALLAIPLGWIAVQTVAGFHYAHLYVLPGAGTPLQFPGGKDPDPWDFLYFAFTIGMTAQVSDVTISTTRLRRAVLLHAVLSFFYNTVILALAVNAGLKLI